ncbi:nuclear transport factor 2 family protein [Pseudonocardia pini]|uniref:nuclear transport factor 2 family protein n=1 Tax=Pseudonocardia pini TaxID=2758030 RepID=UPI0015F0A309|nr:nuclear transport factor 2 family protein [Pseudonocardia pini]
MTARIQEIAEAFSRHDFALAYPHLAPDVRWVAHGAGTTTGRDEVTAVCERTLTDLARTTTTFPSWRTVVGEDAVVVDVVARYEQPDGVFVVASCDLYDFTDGMITAITSYVVELPST